MKKKGIMGISVICLLCLSIGLAVFIKKGNDKKVEPLVASEVGENGIFSAGDYFILAMDKYEENYSHLMSKKLNEISKLYLNDTMKKFYSVVPEKSYFVENDIFPRENYDSMLSILKEEVKGMEYIDLFGTLSISDYYKTDLHWKQEKLFPVVEKLGKSMDFKINTKNFKENIIDDYYGVYKGYGIEAKSETLTYLTNDYTQNALVSVFDVAEQTGVYFMNAFNTDVWYNMFLSGPNPLITIENPAVTNGRELIIFGDSFSSSLTPLLLEAYQKITLIDLRFVATQYLGEIIDFTSQDVLFLYNAQIVNRCAMLR
ncbi:DHHW family protein [Lachnoclostridium phytofermentans]|uniref:AlgX/AlgJ SGNH hydrolase-like domain-containing protein n=1 Tax=Lachnoclostridium phytofermentans (strain ATCC 700394 / DSM 18823 / ISDg) TaxID=357809 RepID=A9KIT1_LACP7|nr:DHHW family protein [Lachnoclostridium phytofermentans]ABX43944.1 hypothetical protein Cphy_3595 [Lachnoclostridium phytofermentans ISDg]